MVLKKPSFTYVICAFVRSGSSQLCAMLSSLGIAGDPNEWYSNTAFDKFEWLFVIPAKAGIHGSPIKAFGDDKNDK